MDLHSAHFPLRRESFDVPFRILRALRMDGAEGDQALSVLLRELTDEAVHILGEAHHLGRDVVDQARPLDARTVEMLEEQSGFVHERGRALPIRDFPPQGVQNQWFQGAVGLDVHMDVGDSGQSRRGILERGKSLTYVEFLRWEW